MSLNLVSSFAVALFLTIAIEIFITFLFGYKDKISLIIVALINVITNPILNYIIILNNSLGFVSYNLVTLSFMECVIVLVEWRMLAYAFNSKDKKLLLLSLTMNLASFLFGVVIFGI